MPAGITAISRHNLLVLAAGMAALYGMVELAFGASTLTFEGVGGSESLAGLAPALFLVTSGLSALPAGRAMDRIGPRPVLLAGFGTGLAGALLAALGLTADSLLLVLAGFALTGSATGIVLLSRVAAASMFPAEGRPRAIALVLFGAVFGALLGPLVFTPLLESGEEGSGLDLAWLGAGGFMVIGGLVASRLRPMPAASEAAATVPAVAGSGSIRRALSRPSVGAALFAVVTSFAAMVCVMSLTGEALVEHGHDHGAVLPVISAHFVGMFAFFALVGPVIERIGRPRAIATGLVLLAVSAIALIEAVEQVHLAGLVLLGVGLGWSLSFVAATAELSERAEPEERGTLIGFADLVGGLTGAAFVVAGGFALEEAGLATVVIGAAVLPLLAAVVILTVGTSPGQPPAPAIE